MTTKLSEHDMLVTLATMALRMNDLTNHDIQEALRAHGYDHVIEEARKAEGLHTEEVERFLDSILPVHTVRKR